MDKRQSNCDLLAVGIIGWQEDLLPYFPLRVCWLLEPPHVSLECWWSDLATSLCSSLRCTGLVFSLMPTELLLTFSFDILYSLRAAFPCWSSLLCLGAIMGWGHWFLAHDHFDLCIIKPVCLLLEYPHRLFSQRLWLNLFLTHCNFIQDSFNTLRPKLKKKKKKKANGLQKDTWSFFEGFCASSVLLQNICTRENTQNNHLFKYTMQELKPSMCSSFMMRTVPQDHTMYKIWDQWVEGT